MPLVSVILPTMKIGGLDVVCSGLQGQTFRDFELIICDGIHKYRNPLIQGHIKNYNFPIKHIEPIGNYSFPLTNRSRYYNTALIYAEGEIVLFIDDFTWLPPNCIETHVKLHNQNTGVMCPYTYVEFPTINYQFQNYLNDLNEGNLNHLMWSIFKTQFVESTEFNELKPSHDLTGIDPKLSMPSGFIPASMFFSKNESCSLESILSVNGYDEEFISPYRDIELSERLSVKIGMKWINEPSVQAKIINFGHFPVDLDGCDEKILKHKRECQYSSPVNNWDLRSYRKYKI